MALTPPERITVKRRRDEDPVEALCKSASLHELHIMPSFDY